jgi:hypothetical protein
VIQEGLRVTSMEQLPFKRLRNATFYLINDKPKIKIQFGKKLDKTEKK